MTVGPRGEAVSRLPDSIAGAQVIRRAVCVEYERAPQQVLEAMEREQPQIVLCVGQAGGRAGITPEYAALNVADAAIADNAGQMRHGEKLVKDGPAAYFSTLPVRTMIAALKQAEIPAALSYTAGTYVCNCVMYHILHAAGKETRAGFIHVPFSAAQAARRDALTPSMPLEMMTRGLEICIRTAVEAVRTPMDKND